MSIAVPFVAGATDAGDSFPESIAQAARVARVTITGIAPVMYTFNDAQQVCGYKITATPTEALKGGERSFEFFAERTIDAGVGDELFSIVRERPPDSRPAGEQLIQRLDDSEAARYRCELASGRYFVKSHPPQVIPFDAKALSEFGGDWLRSESTILAELRLPHRAVRSTTGEHQVVRWEDLRDFIRQTEIISFSSVLDLPAAGEDEPPDVEKRTASARAECEKFPPNQARYRMCMNRAEGWADPKAVAFVCKGGIRCEGTRASAKTLAFAGHVCAFFESGGFHRDFQRFDRCLEGMNIRESKNAPSRCGWEQLGADAPLDEALAACLARLSEAVEDIDRCMWRYGWLPFWEGSWVAAGASQRNKWKDYRACAKEVTFQDRYDHIWGLRRCMEKRGWEEQCGWDSVD